MKPKNISVIGIGRLGLCFALCLEKGGYSVVGVDVNATYVDELNKKTFQTDEPHVRGMLQDSKNLIASTDLKRACDHADILFLLVDTPSGGRRHYDCSKLSRLLQQMNKLALRGKHIVISCTIFPGYTADVGNFLISDCAECTLSYNPEFIAQGNIIEGLLTPDMVLIGEGSDAAGSCIADIYKHICTVQDSCIRRMTPTSAEITKLAVNCFITTKISFANMIGDIADATRNADADEILQAVGCDSRAGHKCLYGYEGPYFPRETRALGAYAESVKVKPLLPVATDAYNQEHTRKQAEALLKENREEYAFWDVAYAVPIVEESQKLKIACILADAGKRVVICDRPAVISAVQAEYGNYGGMFCYENNAMDCP